MADPRNPFGFLSEEQIRTQGWTNRDEFDDAARRYLDAFGLDDAMSLPSEFFTKAAVENTLKKAPAPKVITPPETPTIAPVVPPRMFEPRRPDETTARLREAARGFVAAEEQKALQEGTVLTPAERTAVKEFTAQEVQKSRDIGAAPSYSVLAEAAKTFGVDKLFPKIVSALEPQPIMSDKQVEEYKQALTTRQTQAEQAFLSYYDQNRKDFEGVLDKNVFMGRARDQLDDFKFYSDAPGSFYGPDVVGPFLLQEALTGNGWSPEYKEAYERSLATGDRPSNPEAGLLSTVDESGRLVESSIGATLRGLVLGETLIGATGQQIGGALASAVKGEGLTTKKGFEELVAERVAKGEGLEKVGTSIAEIYGAEEGSFASDAAWWLGLASGFFLPIDAGITDAAKTAGKLAARSETLASIGTSIAKKAGIEVAENPITTLKGIIATGGDVEATIKKGLSEGIDIRTLAVDNADLIPEVNKVSKLITSVDREALGLARSVDDLKAVLQEAAAKADVDYDDFVRTAKGLGLDEFIPTGSAKTVLPISDSPKGWLSFIDELSNRAATQTGRLADPTTLLSREIVKGRLDKAIAQGALPAPEMVMITPTVAMAKEQVPAFLKRLREEPVMDALAKASDQTGDTIELTNKDIRLIRETVGGRQTELVGIEPALRAELQQARVRETMIGTPIATADENAVSLTVSRRALNDIIDRVVGKFASQEGSGLTLGQLQTISKATEVAAETLPSVQKFNAALTRVRLSETFTPVATRPTGFIKLWNENVLPLLEVYGVKSIKKSVISPQEAYAKNNIISSLAGIPDAYKIDYDRFLSQAKSQGLTGEAAHDFAYAETIAKPFEGYEEGNLFANFFAAYYGGYDSVIELEVLRSGTSPNKLKGVSDLINVFLATFQRVGKTALPGEPVLTQLARIYKEQTDNVGRLRVLTLGAKLMEGRPLYTFVDSKVVDKGTKVYLERVKDFRPQFSQANIKVPMFAAYLQQERAVRTLKAANDLRASDAITKSITFKTAILNGGEALARNIDTTIKELYDVSDPEFFSALSAASQTAVSAGIIDNLATRNSGIATSNSRYAKEFYIEVLDLLKAGLSDGVITQRTIPSGITDDIAKVTLADNIYRSLGFILQIDRTDPATTLRMLANREGKLVKDSSPNVADDVTNLVLGSYSPALTNDQMKSWVYALNESVKAQKETARKKKIRSAVISAETALNGIYNVNEMKEVIRKSSSLRAVEEAITAFDWLRDPRIYDALTPEEKVIIAEKLADRTADFTQRLTDAIDSISVKELPRQQLKTILAQTGYAASTFMFETLPGFVKQSILAGAIAPNFINQFQNYLTAPLMMAVTSTRDPGKRFILEFLTNYNIFSKRTIKTPTGKIYTYKDIEELSSNLGLGASSAQRAEISKNLLRDLINYAGTMGTGGPLGTFERRKGFFTNLAKGLGLGDLSVMSQFSNNVDLAFRRKVVARALEEGRTEAEAVAEARKALFDYNDLTEVERNSIAKYIWFYRFMRQNLVQTTVAFLDNPAKIARLAKLSKVQASKMFDMASGGDGELHPDLAQYKESKAFVALIDGMDKERLAIYTPSIPILEATSQLINGAAMIGLIGTNIDALAGLAEPMDPLSRDKIIEKFLDDYSLAGPAVEAVKIGIARTLGIQITGFDKEPIIYLDPRFVAMSKAMGNWDTIMAHFEIEMDARDPRAGITTFDGYYYRLGKSPENKTRWQMFMNLVQTAGVSRTIRDYAIILPYLQAVPGMEAGTEISTGDPLLDAVKFLGVFSVGAQPTPEAAQQNIRRELIKSLEERSK